MKKSILSGAALAFLLAVCPITGEAADKGNDIADHTSAVNQTAEQGEYIKGEVIVKFEDDAAHQNKGAALNELNAQVTPDKDPVKSSFKVLEVGNVDKAVKALNNNPNVEYAEPNYKMESTWSPNDPYANRDYQYGLFTTNTNNAWDVTRGSSNQEIAVVDTGVDYNHEDLSDKTILGYDFVENDDDPLDQNGHGTHVAGTAAAETNNGTGVAGMAPESSILAVRVLDAQGSGSLANIVDGIRYAADHGAEVINLSLGCDCDTQAMEDAVNYAWNKGSVVIAAAGNAGVSTQFEPASYDNVIAVAAVDSQNNLASFSNYGSWVDVAAPGVDIASTVQRNGYAYMSGTSMASPHVAGLAGLLAAQGRDNAEIRSAIENTANPISGTGSNFEHGLIDSESAVKY
ncbi:S8 family peptidase [Lentibacillus jeotgali]|uniref:S8 family peptidase n=1 Tax=Lentibacillus jeotgali TaxID=558169 RepID=UPI0002628C12|nr:S8 family peptidase [Lentibacillus jeotgali]